MYKFRLRDTAIVQAKKEPKPYKLTDGGGLFLHVAPTGTKSWRFQFKYAKKYQLICLGTYPEVTLAQARLEHAELQTVLRSGRNPAEDRRQAKPEVPAPKPAAASVNSFAAVHALWFEDWREGRSPSYVEQMKTRMAQDVLPKLGKRPITEIDAPEVAAVAKAVEGRGAKELARMTLRNIGLVFRFAIVKGYAKRNPASDFKPKDIFKRATVVNHSRVDERDLPALLLAIEDYGSFLTRMVMRTMARTFVRTGELVEATWDEFDLEGGRWTIPKERMKMKQFPHIVPLAWQVVEDLKSIRETTGNTEWVFPMAKNPKRPMSRNTILTALKLMGYHKVMTGHGFRGIASTILHEQGYEEAHIETQLAHLKRSKVGAAYDYSKYLAPRTKMMQDWSDYLDEKLNKAKTAATFAA